jgi:virulence factor Mce-like protein
MRIHDTKRLRLELRRSVKPLALFAFLVACGAVSMGVIFKNQTFQKPWEDYYEVRASFDDAKGVVSGSQQVRMAGVTIGVIKAVDLVDGRPVLTLSIRSKYGRLYRDARMRLRPLTPLQDLYVDVRRGTPGAGTLSEQAILPGERTQTPVDVARVLNTFDPDTRQRLGVLVDQLGAGLEDRGASLRTAFAQAVPFLNMAKRATGVLSRRRAVTSRLVSNLAGLMDELAQHNDQIASLIGNGERTLGELAGHDRNLTLTLRELPATLTAMRGAFASVRGAEDELDPALRSLDPVLTELQDGLQALKGFGTDARPALAALRAPVRSLNPLARDLDPTARSLRRALVPLVPQASQFDRITALFPPCLDQLSGFFNNTMSFMKFQDAGGVIPRAQATFGADSLTPLLGDAGVPEPTYRAGPTCTPGGQKP